MTLRLMIFPYTREDVGERWLRLKCVDTGDSSKSFRTEVHLGGSRSPASAVDAVIRQFSKWVVENYVKEMGA